ncbi:MAG TPA: 16S rRNA (cytosine(1402)-N(4))-methyltransferase RsmH [Gemmatimonadales bacterium]|nr:16S rRNA (cytosine(1402)-N(4))-methyltransferase RsmH [Gemmatimonadales bacterium]
MSTMPPRPSHVPVLLEPILEMAAGAHRVVDGTLGHGGHAEALLVAGAAAVLGIDRDPEAIAIATERLAGRPFTPLLATYSSGQALDAIGRFEPDFILLDLGVSSRQLDDTERGFSFREGAPLDMRMGPDAPTAADWLATVDREELTRVLRDYADERRPGRMASEILRRRDSRPYQTSDDLVGAIRAVLGPRSGPGEFARVFQAVRIAVNDELAGLERALPAMREALAAGGSLAVISYHSGEDRLVKHAFRDWSVGCVCPPAFPRCACGRLPLGEAVPRRAIVASEGEVHSNPRARSARLRRFRRAPTTR